MNKKPKPPPPKPKPKPKPKPTPTIQPPVKKRGKARRSAEIAKSTFELEMEEMKRRETEVKEARKAAAAAGPTPSSSWTAPPLMYNSMDKDGNQAAPKPPPKVKVRTKAGTFLYSIFGNKERFKSYRCDCQTHAYHRASFRSSGNTTPTGTRGSVHHFPLYPTVCNHSLPFSPLNFT